MDWDPRLHAPLLARNHSKAFISGWGPATLAGFGDTTAQACKALRHLPVVVLDQSTRHAQLHIKIDFSASCITVSPHVFARHARLLCLRARDHRCRRLHLMLLQSKPVKSTAQHHKQLTGWHGITPPLAGLSLEKLTAYDGCTFFFRPFIFVLFWPLFFFGGGGGG